MRVEAVHKLGDMNVLTLTEIGSLEALSNRADRKSRLRQSS
jgi:hypothetical protein